MCIFLQVLNLTTYVTQYDNFSSQRRILSTNEIIIILVDNEYLYNDHIDSFNYNHFLIIFVYG